MSLLNFFNFLISFFYSRTKEYTVRKVYGGNYRQLFLQLYVHSAIMVILSSVVMFSLVELLGNNLRFSFALAEIDIIFSRHLLMEHALQYLAMILVVCATICHFIARRLHKIPVYSGTGTGVYGKSVVGRNIMLWWQLLISWIFIGIVLAMAMQSHLNTGTLFPTLSKKQKMEILSIPMEYSFLSNAQKQALVDEFSKHPGVSDAMLCDISLVEGYSGVISLYWEGEKDKPWFEANVISAPVNYFSFMNVPLLQGRMPAANGEIIVDKRFAELHGPEVTGRNIFSHNGHYTICGVSDPHESSFYTDNFNPDFLLASNPKGEYIGHCYLKCHPGQVSTAYYFGQSCSSPLPLW